MQQNEARKTIDAVCLVALVAVPIAWSPARADDDPVPDESSGPIATATEPATAVERDILPAARPHDRTAADVAAQPVPGSESGRLDRIDGGDSSLRIATRGLLFLPKVALQIAVAPIRGVLWADDRYLIRERWHRWFWNDAHTIGLYPTAAYESGLGIVGGARFVHQQLFGEAEELVVQATVGTIYRQSHAVKLRSGDRFGSHLELSLDARFDRYPRNPFYGIGNSDEVSQPDMPIDPRVDSTAVKTRHRTQAARAVVAGDVRVVSNVHAIVRAALTDIQLDRSDEGPAIDEVYDPAGLVGFDGITTGYGELELKWDTRNRENLTDPHRELRAGTLASVFAGWMAPLDGGTAFWHYGTYLQQYFRLAGGPRVLVLRLHGEGVTGSVDEVPFIQLPFLGGSSFLRGYDHERFRDRVAVVGSAQYIWDLSHHIDAYLFVDAGRVYPSLSDLSFDDLRVGYGLGFDLHDVRGFLMEAAIGSSIDGGVMLSLSFNPVLDSRPRWR